MAAAKREAWVKEDQPVQIRKQEIDWEKEKKAKKASTGERKRQADVVEAVAQAVLDKVAMEEGDWIRNGEGATEEMELDGCQKHSWRKNAATKLARKT